MSKTKKMNWEELTQTIINLEIKKSNTKHRLKKKDLNSFNKLIASCEKNKKKLMKDSEGRGRLLNNLKYGVEYAASWVDSIDDSVEPEDDILKEISSWLDSTSDWND